MIFHPRRLNLVKFAKSQDIVANDIFSAVVLMEAAGLGIIDQIVFHNDITGALISVKTPAAVGIRINIVKNIIAHDSSFRGSDGRRLKSKCETTAIGTYPARKLNLPV